MQRRPGSAAEASHVVQKTKQRKEVASVRVRQRISGSSTVNGLFFHRQSYFQKPCTAIVNLAGFAGTWSPHPATGIGLGAGVGWAKANQRQSALSGRTIGQNPHTSTHQSASDGPPEYALQPSDRASHGSRDQSWQNGSARCGRHGHGEHIPVGRRWSDANVTSFDTAKPHRRFTAHARGPLWPTLHLRLLIPLFAPTCPGSPRQQIPIG